MTDNCSNSKYFDKMSEQFWHKNVSNEDIEEAKSAYRDAFQYAILVSAKGQLISKGNIGDFKSTKKTNEIFVSIFAPASKNCLKQKRKGNLLYLLGVIFDIIKCFLLPLFRG